MLSADRTFSISSPFLSPPCRRSARITATWRVFPSFPVTATLSCAEEEGESESESFKQGRNSEACVPRNFGACVPRNFSLCMRCVTRESGHLWQVSFNPTEDEIKAGASVRFGGRADTFMFSHIAVTPTAGWGDVTAVGYCLAWHVPCDGVHA